MMKATKLNKALMVRRFIDDIIVISENNTLSIEIIENFKNTFKEHDLNLTSTIISTESEINVLSFLDVEHIFTKANEKKFFLHHKFYKSYSNRFYLFKWQIVSLTEYFQWNYYKGRENNKYKKRRLH